MVALALHRCQLHLLGTHRCHQTRYTHHACGNARQWITRKAAAAPTAHPPPVPRAVGRALYIYSQLRLCASKPQVPQVQLLTPPLPPGFPSPLRPPTSRVVSPYPYTAQYAAAGRRSDAENAPPTVTTDCMASAEGGQGHSSVHYKHLWDEDVKMNNKKILLM